MKINISETIINPDGADFSSGTKIGNFLVIRSNDTNRLNVTRHTLRLYFDIDPATYTGGVKIYYYNTTASPIWEALTTTASGNESGRWYIEAAPNHFSSLGIITASVEVLKSTSTLVNTSQEGLVYKNANIWVGTSGFATPKNIKEALIKFRIDNAWMSSNTVLASDIVLVKWDGSS